MRTLATMLCLTAALPARADAPASPPTAPAPPPVPDDFDLLPPPPPPNPAAVKAQEDLDKTLRLRRRMLVLHQGVGLAALATLGATVVLGQLNYVDKYGGGGDTGRYYNWHVGLVITSSTLFAATGGLGLFAPSPLDKKLQLDTATVHKALMATATAGMSAEIVMGLVTKAQEGHLVQRDWALAHQVVGWTTFGAMALGFGVLLL